MREEASNDGRDQSVWMLLRLPGRSGYTLLNRAQVLKEYRAKISDWKEGRQAGTKRI